MTQASGFQALEEVSIAKADADLIEVKCIAQEEAELQVELNSLKELTNGQSGGASIKDGLAFCFTGEASWSLWHHAKQRELNLKLADVRVRKELAVRVAQKSSGRADVVKKILAEQKLQKKQQREKLEFDQMFSVGMLNFDLSCAKDAGH